VKYTALIYGIVGSLAGIAIMIFGTVRLDHGHMGGLGPLLAGLFCLVSCSILTSTVIGNWGDLR
jgi:hypothetical protein